MLPTSGLGTVGAFSTPIPRIKQAVKPRDRKIWVQRAVRGVERSLQSHGTEPRGGSLEVTPPIPHPARTRPKTARTFPWGLTVKTSHTRGYSVIPGPEDPTCHRAVKSICYSY